MKMTTRIASLCLVGIFIGCGKDSAKGTDYVLARESKLSEAEQTQIVAKIGERTITLQEFESRLNQQSVFARNRHNSPARKKDFLESLIRFELLAVAAVEKGYDKDPDVQLAMKQAMVKRFTSKELSQLVKMADITEAELKTYYDQNPDEFNRPGQVRASHIVLGDEAGANQLLAALKADIAKQPAKARATFGEYASKTTIDDATKARKGDLGFFGEPGKSAVKRPQNAPMVHSEVAKAAYAVTEVGGLYDRAVKTPAGWHLVMKTGYRRPFTRSFADMRNKLRLKLFRQKKSEAMEAYVKDLRQRAKIVVNDAALEAAKMARPRQPAPRLAPPAPLQNAPKGP